MIKIPKLDENLTKEHLNFLETFAKSCRHSILQMVVNSQSGHPGGSLSSIDYLSLLYAFIVGQTGEKVVISSGHISPAVYSTLGEMGYIDKEDAIKNFRKNGSVFEGHVTRHVAGVFYGTGPLGIGVSVATAFALAERMKVEETEKSSAKKVFCLMGDGEVQEGEVHEAIQFSGANKLNNFILFVDYNRIQLTDSLENIQNIDVKKIFEAGGWKAIDIDAHDFTSIWSGLGEAYRENEKPVLLIGHSIMGKGVSFMENDGKCFKATWHGKAPKAEEADEDIKKLELGAEEKKSLQEFLKLVKWRPEKPEFPELNSAVEIDTVKPILYGPEVMTDCRTAYGQALLDLAKLNPSVIALSADLRASVMTKYVAEALPKQHVEFGIAEQNMVAAAGGLSLAGYIPFASTFGAFMSSRAKDQARVNDINQTNVKMVATHCGLSVGEDGPTHQAIDDMGSFLGMFNTMVIEPADPNHTDRIIRHIASHYGNFYVRMGRHKVPVIEKEETVGAFYSDDYKYEYGKCDILRKGDHITVAAAGSCVTEAIKAHTNLKKSHPDLSIEIIAVSSIKKFDDTLSSSIKKTGKLITVEDHNPYSGLASQLALHLSTKNIHPKITKNLAVTHYELSGKPEELYHNAGIDAANIEKTILELYNN